MAWLDAAAEAVQRSGKCTYHHLLQRVRLMGSRDPMALRGKDLARKRELHSIIVRELGGVCATCGRGPDHEYPHVGFDLNHRVCRRDGGPKQYNMSDFWICWEVIQGTTASAAASARNRAALDMPFKEARDAMRREAARCELLCRSCHSIVTQDQNGRCYEWPRLAAWLEDRIIRGVVQQHTEQSRVVVPVLHISI